jgi:putative thioredoxin
VLERLAAEGGGSWVLAKVDVDANPALAQGLRVQGIPAVKAVWQGQLVAEFTGAIPEEDARRFVTELVAATTGGAVPSGSDDEAAAGLDDPRLDAAEEALERGDLAAAEAAYRAILDAEPDHPEAGLALRQVQLFRRAEEAGPDALATADAEPEDVEAQVRAADFLLGTGNVEAAFDRLLDVVRRTAGDDRDRARTHLVELFGIVGDQDPRVGVARRQLTLALY